MDFLPVIPEGVAPHWYYLCIGAAVLITGMSKAGFGGGTGILAVPLVAMVVPPAHMLGLMLPVLIACDILSNLHYLRQYDGPRLRSLLVGAAMGIAIGTAVHLLLQNISQSDFSRVMNLVVGSVCLGMVGVQAWRLTGRPVPTLPPHPLSAVFVGCFAGSVSTINHSAGPIVSIYLLQERLAKRVLVSTLLVCFLVINLAKVPSYVYLGYINERTLRDSVWFIPLIPVGTLSGAWMNRHIPEKPFVVVMYAAAAVTAGYMVYKALA